MANTNPRYNTNANVRPGVTTHVRPNTVNPNNTARPNTARPNTARPNPNAYANANNYANANVYANAYANPYANINKDPSKPNYVMKKSSWSVIKWWHILFGILIIPLLIMLWKIINIKDETISFYDNKIVQKSGILNKYEKTTIMTRVLSVTIKQTLWGRIFNYGDIVVDVVGKWDVDTKGIKSPRKAKEYLEKMALNGNSIRPVIMN